MATHIERLEGLSRTALKQPTSIELTSRESGALVLLGRQISKCTEAAPDTMSTMGRTSTWIAELAGYAGRASSGPPGSIMVHRDLRRPRPATMLLPPLESERG